MTQTVEQALSQAAFYSDDEVYALVKLPHHAVMAAAGVLAQIKEPFGALIIDKDELTLVTFAEALEDFASRLPGLEVSAIHYRLITLDVALEPDLVGFMARISAELAAANISFLPLAAYSRDHLLIPAEKFEGAMKALERLKSSAI